MTIQEVLNQLVQQNPPNSIWLERPAPHVLSLKLTKAKTTVQQNMPLATGALLLGGYGLMNGIPNLYWSWVGQYSFGLEEAGWLLLCLLLSIWAIRTMVIIDQERWLELLVSNQGVSLHQRTKNKEEALLAQFLWQDIQQLHLELPPAKKWQQNHSSYLLLTIQQKKYPFLQEELKREETSYCFYILQAIWKYQQTGNLPNNWLPSNSDASPSSNTNLFNHLIEED